MTVRRSMWVALVALASLVGWLTTPATADDPSAPARGAASAWGLNNFGQLGNNTTTFSLVPVTVNTTGTINGEAITTISAGQHHTCAVAGGKAYCWGKNVDGQLGNNTTTNTQVPVAVNTSGALTGTVTTISAGNSHTCAVAGGKAYCWGSNAFGQLGNNNTTNSSVPVAVNTSGALTGTVTTISAGYNDTCAVADGKAACWGTNVYGQLGNNTYTGSSVPVAVTTGGALTGTVTAISAGERHTCAVADAKAYCWGYNSTGRLGNNSTTDSPVPVAVTTGGALTGTVTTISAGYNHTCAVADAKASCWGYGFLGQLGNSANASSSVPVAVTTGGALTGTVTRISAGYDHTCAVADAKASCWGKNSTGQLGNNTTTDSTVPVAVTTGGALTGTVTTISAGYIQTAAVSTSPYLTVSAPSIPFSNQLVGSSSPEQTATITNTGGASLTVSAAALSGTDPGQFTKGTDTCIGSVAPTTSCTVKVRFTPTSAGDKTATLTITSSAPGSPHNIALTGTGTIAVTDELPQATQEPDDEAQTLRPGLPKRIKVSGLTLITPANARTNADQRVRTIVRGKPAKTTEGTRSFRIVRGPNGKVSVRTFGRLDLKLTVTQEAPATTGYTAFRARAKYVGGKRQN